VPLRSRVILATPTHTEMAAHSGQGGFNLLPTVTLVTGDVFHDIITSRTSLYPTEGN
jgi:hypothetical protein